MKRILRQIILIIFLIIISIINSDAQEKVQSLRGIILDNSLNKGIAGVHIINLKDSTGTTTDSNGKFNLEKILFPACIAIHHISYYADTIIFTNNEEFNKVYPRGEGIFFLRPNVREIEEVTITAHAMKLFADEPFAIIDYQFMNKNIIAIGYRNYNEFKKEIMLANSEGKVLWSQPAPKVLEVYQDCMGGTYLVGQDSVWLVEPGEEIFEIASSCSKTYFNNNIRTINIISDSLIIFNRMLSSKQFQEYFMLKGTNQEAKLVYQVGDLRKEFGLIGLNSYISLTFKKVATTNDPDQLRAYYSQAFRNIFLRQMEYKPVYSEVYVDNATLLLFDFALFKIVRMDLNGIQTGETPMKTLFSDEWVQKMHRDPGTGRYYLEFLKGQLSYLIEINPYTGNEVRKIPIINFKHIDHLKIFNDRIYFLHQPDFGDRGKKLYFINI